MKLAAKDELEHVYMFNPEQQEDPVALWGEREIHLKRLKTAKRDAKGTKPR